jgi:RNA polymerase sigma-70 factor, ECF subfamily
MKHDISELYTRFGPMVYRRCLHFLRDDDTALDAMQEVFVQVVRHSGRLEFTAPSSLLYTMATNHCLNLLHQRKRRGGNVPAEIIDLLPAKERFVERIHAQSALTEIFALHDQKTRTIAWLHFVDGFTLEQTASEIGMSVSGVRKRLRQLKATALTLEALP